MAYLTPTREQARAGLRTMKTILTVAGPLSPARRTVIDAAQRHLLHTDLDLDALEPITPAELAAAVEDPRLRAQFVSALVTLALASDKVEPRELDAIDALAAALDVRPAELDQLHRLAAERTLLLRFDLARRGLAGAGVKRLYAEEGFLGLVANLASFLGLRENTAVAARYLGLEAYADGTLGKELYRFYRSNKFPFPGEKHGAPEALLTHDLSHILGGYGADMPGEAQVLCFQAGYRRQDPFTVVVFLLVQGQHGLRLTPFAEAGTTLIDDGALLGRMVEAFARGAQMNIDLTGEWDFWAVMGEPVDELRARYGIAR
jgi:hypothetical protein